MLSFNADEINELRVQYPDFNEAMDAIQDCQHSSDVSQLLNKLGDKTLPEGALLFIIASIPKHITDFRVPCKLLRGLSDEAFQAVFKALPEQISMVDFSRTLASDLLRPWPVLQGAILGLHKGVISLNFSQSFIGGEENFEHVKMFFSQLPAHITELDITYINAGRLADNFDTAALLSSLPVTLESLTLSFEQCWNMRRIYNKQPDVNEIRAVFRSVSRTIRDLKLVGFSVSAFEVEQLHAAFVALPVSCHTLVFSQTGSLFFPRGDNQGLSDFDVFLRAANALPSSVTYIDFSSGISLQQMNNHELENSEGKFPHVKKLALNEGEIGLLSQQIFSTFMKMFPNLVIFERGTTRVTDPDSYPYLRSAKICIRDTTRPNIFFQYAIQHVIWISFIDYAIIPSWRLSRLGRFSSSLVTDVVLNNFLMPWVSKKQILLGFYEHPVYMKGVSFHPIYEKIKAISEPGLREKVAFTLMQYFYDTTKYHLYPDEAEVLVMLDRIITGWQKRINQTLAAGSSVKITEITDEEPQAEAMTRSDKPPEGGPL